MRNISFVRKMARPHNGVEQAEWESAQPERRDNREEVTEKRGVRNRRLPGRFKDYILD